MEITSPAFEHHQPIPKKYTCEGEDLSPELDIIEIPKGCKSIAIIMDDPDAPIGTFDHWIVWNIDPATTHLKEGVEGLNMGINGFRQVKYRGPCPPPGKPHRYFFKCYALDIEIDIPVGSTKERLEEAMEGHILSRAELIGTYQR